MSFLVTRPASPVPGMELRSTLCSAAIFRTNGVDLRRSRSSAVSSPPLAVAAGAGWGLGAADGADAGGRGGGGGVGAFSAAGVGADGEDAGGAGGDAAGAGAAGAGAAAVAAEASVSPGKDAGKEKQKPAEAAVKQAESEAERESYIHVVTRAVYRGDDEGYYDFKRPHAPRSTRKDKKPESRTDSSRRPSTSAFESLVTLITSQSR